MNRESLPVIAGVAVSSIILIVVVVTTMAALERNSSGQQLSEGGRQYVTTIDSKPINKFKDGNVTCYLWRESISCVVGATK